jgi:RNase H-fold protein (predicted Holliday junction resolvase)
MSQGEGSRTTAERSNVLEEAAQVCEQMRPVNAGSHVLQVQRDTLDNAARLIRALRSSEQPTSAAAGSTKAAKGEDSHREGLATESHATTRDEIIEECAKVADERAGTVNADKSVTAMYIAERIRSLKNTPIAASATRSNDVQEARRAIESMQFFKRSRERVPSMVELDEWSDLLRRLAGLVGVSPYSVVDDGTEKR